jgi:hypothetical protein
VKEDGSTAATLGVMGGDFFPFGIMAGLVEGR